MGVQLNIKDPETVRLARELAQVSGTSVTHAIRTLLERALAEREADIQRRIAGFDSLVDEIRQHLPVQWKGKTSKEVMDELYDDNGLPA